MSRTDRNRQAEYRDELDLRDRDGPSGTARELVEFFDGGAIPTSVPRVFLSHPVRMDVADTEGATGLGTVDTSVTLPVVVLGPKIPVAGDRAVAHAVGGRWVSGVGGSPPVPCTPYLFSCPACNGYLIIDNGTVTDDQGTHAFDLTGTTARISWTTPDGYNGVDDTPTTITTQYYYTFQCADVGGVHKVILAIHFWTIDVNGDGSVWLYDSPDVPGEEDGASTSVTPSGCNPLTSSHTFVYNVALPPEPTATATVSIPESFGYTCSPCCVPLPPAITSLTATWANPTPGGVCPSTPLTLVFSNNSGIPSWSSRFCPGTGGFFLGAGILCFGGNLVFQTTDQFSVNGPFVCTWTLVDCTLADGVFHAHFSSPSCNGSDPQFNDVYVDS